MRALIYSPLLSAPQGWECPKCGGVYAPYTPMCFSCGNAKFVTQPRTGTGDPIPNPDTTVWSGVNGTIAGSPDLNIGCVMYGAN